MTKKTTWFFENKRTSKTIKKKKKISEEYVLNKTGATVLSYEIEVPRACSEIPMN